MHVHVYSLHGIKIVMIASDTHNPKPEELYTSYRNYIAEAWTKEFCLEKFLFRVNIGYTNNENKRADREQWLQISHAAEGKIRFICR